MPLQPDGRTKWYPENLKNKYERITRILNSHKGKTGESLNDPIKFTCLECLEDTVNHCKFAYSMYNVAGDCIVREGEALKKQEDKEKATKAAKKVAKEKNNG
jgi:hypothetical protein